MPHINQQTRTLLRDNEALIFRIATAMGKKFRTIDKWLRDNDSRLALPAVRLIIANELSIHPDDVLETQPSAKTANAEA